MKQIKLHEYVTREYKIILCEKDITIEYLSLSELLSDEENTYEYIYALQDVLDLILTMELGKSHYFQPNRDDKNSKGIIKRIL